MNQTELLISLGLSPTEATTYLAMLELESVSIRKVADKTGINRGTTYDAMKHLKDLGLISSRTIGQREVYSAESPERIQDIIRDRRKELLVIAEHAQKIVPAMLADTARPQGEPLVRFYQDDEGIVTILKDVLQTCSKMDNAHYYVYSSRRLRNFMYRKFPHFTEQRIREGIEVKVIAVGEGGDQAPVSERKWMEEPDGPVSSYSIIYGNKVAHISLAGDFTPYGVVIEDPGMATMQRLIFERLWQQL